MLTHIFVFQNPYVFTVMGSFFSFIVAFITLKYASVLLPTDHGRAYAIEGTISKGKPTGAGILFISIFIFSALLFVPLKAEYLLSYFFLFLAMFFGYLDDRAQKPWSEYRKALLDVIISIGVAGTLSCFSSREVIFPILGISRTLPWGVFFILAVILVLVSINVTNCTDGVDGLSASLVMISLISMYILSVLLHTVSRYNDLLPIMISILVAYLWFNTHPSSLLMGDAGSRALGVFLAICIMQTKQPFAYIPICLLIIINGSAGIIKISLKRYVKISILTNIRTPIHDHFRKNLNWTNPQVTIRFSIVHAVICAAYLSLVYCLMQR